MLTLATTISLYNIHTAYASAYMEPALASALANASPFSSVQVVVVLDHIPTSGDSQAFQSYAKTAFPMTKLPMILAYTNYGNLTRIASYSGAVSLWNNRQLTYYGNVQTVTHTYGEVPTAHSWWNDVMHVTSVWNTGDQGQGVTVALIDTGIDATNPSLGYNFPNGQAKPPYRVIQNVKVLASTGVVIGLPTDNVTQLYLENQPNTDTSSGHGTSTSGAVAGTGDGSNGIYKGVAPRANIVGLGAGDGEFIFYVIASFNYIIANQAKYNIRIVSNSYGTTGSADTPTLMAIQAAHDAGIAVFFAGGNSGPGSNTLNPYATPSYVIDVGAGTQEKGLTEFSSRGVPGDPALHPDLVAPGINVITTKDTIGAVDGALSATADQGNIVSPYQTYYTTFDGTSCATPLAAGVGALVLEANPSLNPDQLKTILTGSTDPMLGYLTFQVGTGFVNAQNAVRLALGQGVQLSNTRTQAFGDQRYIYTEYLGGAFGATTVWLGTSTPVYQGVQSITFKASWATPALPRQWRMEIYAPNDKVIAACASATSGKLSLGVPCLRTNGNETSLTYAINNATLISSLNNPGKTSGIWDVILLNFDYGEAGTITIDVNYPAKTHQSMMNAHDLQETDSQQGGLQGSEEAILQAYDGTVLTTQQVAVVGATTVSTDITQPVNTVITVTQIVVVDTNGNILEVRGAWVTTQADLNTRAAQIQQLLLTTTDPAQVSALQTELSTVQTALLTAPLSENLPVLP